LVKDRKERGAVEEEGRQWDEEPVKRQRRPRADDELTWRRGMGVQGSRAGRTMSVCRRVVNSAEQCEKMGDGVSGRRQEECAEVMGGERKEKKVGEVVREAVRL